MSSPLVRCSSCEREWHSATMAEGLRGMDSCPRCAGPLVFAESAPTGPAAEAPADPAADTAPHLVLGVPRR